MYRRLGLISSGSVVFGCRGVTLILGMASASYRRVELHCASICRDCHVLVATISLANPGHLSNPAIIKLGMARDGILHVDLLSELCQISTEGYPFESLVSSESISLHVASRGEPTRTSAKPDEDVVLSTKAWRRVQLRLVVSSNLDCLRWSTRGRFAIGWQTNLLESREIHECRNRLHNVVCWSFVTTLHEGGTGGTVRMSVSPRRFRKKESS